MNNKEILIVCALEQETQEELNDWLPFTDNPVWNVLYTGVGKVNATRKLTERFSSYQSIPAVRRNHELVINYGTAGSRELPIGELVDCTKFIQRDMNAVQFGFMKGQTPFENDVPLILDSTHIEFNPIQKHQVCGTGDNFVDNIEDEHSMIDVFDMEAYALAKVCHYYYVPFISFKYITDNANEHSPKDWEENLANGIIEFKDKILSDVER
jgi:adenosylhomocysteine nucleosidase